jgi:hypothetical protein
MGSIISKEERLIGNYIDYAGDADYIPLSGTSMSAPIVSGALAILMEAYPYLTPEAARIALLEGAKRLQDESDDDFLKSGMGLINISASLNYLNSLSLDYNDTAKYFPDILPVKPYDLLQFPGDHQKFNLTILSGKSNTYNIEVPNDIQGISLTIDKPTINFPTSGIDFVELGIKVDMDALPGIRSFQINLTVGGQIYDVVDIQLEIRIPEHRILLDSFHGLNDWFPEISFNQMGFYEAMKDIADLNISIDYGMEYWTPDYNKNTDNSILTEERLAKYNLVVLQSPILPYSPVEMDNLELHFNNGGSILFLGTRFQDMVVENINHLFSRLELDLQVEEENIVDDNWLGLRTSVSSQSVTDLSNPILFQGVSRFLWEYGNSFTTSGNAESIATLGNKTIAAVYNGTTQGKGRFLAFGDLHWMFEEYKSSLYTADHYNLLRNSLEYLLPDDDLSIYIDIGSERTPSPLVNLSFYMKNQTSETPITSLDYTALEILIENGGYSETIIPNNTYSNYGFYFNNSINLPSTSYNPYTVTVNLTVGARVFTQSSKILYYDNSQVPVINSLSVNTPNITRATGQSINLNAELDNPTYDDFEGYLTIYSSSFLNSKQSENKTITFNHFLSNDYRNTFDPTVSDPSGYGFFYVSPTNENYTNPYSPRASFRIENNPPEILETTSTFSFDGNIEITFEDTETDDGVLLYSVTQGSVFDFDIDVQDTVSYEDDNSEIRVFINIFMVSVTEDGFIIFIFPSTLIVDEILHDPLSHRHEGTFTIPDSLLYSSIAGTKTVPTAANFNINTNEGYLGVLLITIYDSEGESEDFILLLLISGRPPGVSFLMVVILIIVGIAALVGLSIYLAKKRQRSGLIRRQLTYQDYSYQPSYEREEQYLTPDPIELEGSMYCPFCGGFIVQKKRFCPHCGESLAFSEDE